MKFAITTALLILLIVFSIVMIVLTIVAEKWREVTELADLTRAYVPRHDGPVFLVPEPGEDEWRFPSPGNDHLR